MGRGDMVEPEVEILRPSPSEMREYKYIMRKYKNINKRAQIFVQYFYKCLISAIEKKTDRHAADAWGGVRINHVPIPDSECGFDEEDFKNGNEDSSDYRRYIELEKITNTQYESR